MYINKIKAPWEEPQDLLERKKYAEFLTGYLENKKTSFVLNLNAGWGMGKTYFLTNWCKSIQDDHPTVYVNAWESDFSEDPLLAVMASIHDQLSELLPSGQKKLDGFSLKLRSAGRFMRGIAPVITKGLVSKALGDDAGKELAEMVSLSTSDIASVAEKSMGMLLEDHVERTKSLTEFKIALSDIVDSVTNDKMPKPLFLFIDELDRCRPTYAIEMLETVKHLFSVDEIVFVIATDSEQLQHSIRAIYGNDFNGAEYLRRFFDQEYKLPLPDYKSYCQSLAESFPCPEKLEYGKFQPWNVNGATTASPPDWSNEKALNTFLSLYSKHFELSLRSINQVIVRLEAILNNSEVKYFGPFIILLLVIHAKNGEMIDWLRERVNTNDMTRHSDQLSSIINPGGETIRWFSKDNYEDRVVDNFLNTEKMLTDVINSLGRVVNARKSDLSKHYNADTKSLGGYISHLLAAKIMNDSFQYSDLSKYFDHVEMAGALS